jgi:hypothetical protein
MADHAICQSCADHERQIVQLLRRANHANREPSAKKIKKLKETIQYHKDNGHFADNYSEWQRKEDNA